MLNGIQLEYVREKRALFLFFCEGVFIMSNQYHPCMNIWHYFDDCRCTMVYLPGVKRGNRESHFEPIFPLKHIKTPFTDESLVGGFDFFFICWE